jgi:hypothetical protein
MTACVVDYRGSGMEFSLCYHFWCSLSSVVREKTENILRIILLIEAKAIACRFACATADKTSSIQIKWHRLQEKFRWFTETCLFFHSLSYESFWVTEPTEEDIDEVLNECPSDILLHQCFLGFKTCNSLNVSVRIFFNGSSSPFRALASYSVP